MTPVIMGVGQWESNLNNNLYHFTQNKQTNKQTIALHKIKIALQK